MSETPKANLSEFDPSRQFSHEELRGLEVSLRRKMAEDLPDNERANVLQQLRAVQHQMPWERVNRQAEAGYILDELAARDVLPPYLVALREKAEELDVLLQDPELDSTVRQNYEQLRSANHNLFRLQSTPEMAQQIAQNLGQYIGELREKLNR